MPNPGWVPIIGSSFDNLAGQDQYWAGFNARQDDQNIGRANAAEVAQNRWFENLAQMQQRDQERQMAADTAAQQTIAQAVTARRAEAERARQFDVGTAQEEEKLGLSKDQLKFQQDQIASKRQQEDDVAENLGTNLAPDVKEAAIAQERATAEHDKALNDLKTEASRQQAAIGSNLVKYNPRTNEFEPTLKGATIPPELAPKVSAANEALGKVQSDYISAKERKDYAEKQFKMVQQHAYDTGFIVKGSGDSAYLYHPRLNKSYGEIKSDTDVNTDADSDYRPGGANPIPNGPVWGGFTPQTSTGTTPPPAAPSAVPAGSPFQIRQVPAGTPATVKFNPDNGSLMPVGAPSDSGRPVQSQPAAAPFVPRQPAPASNFRTPNDVYQLYYAGRLSKTDAIATLSVQFPGYERQLSNQPEWHNPPAPQQRLYWNENVQPGYPKISYGVPPSPYE